MSPSKNQRNSVLEDSQLSQVKLSYEYYEEPQLSAELVGQCSLDKKNAELSTQFCEMTQQLKP